MHTYLRRFSLSLSHCWHVCESGFNPNSTWLDTTQHDKWIYYIRSRIPTPTMPELASAPPVAYEAQQSTDLGKRWKWHLRRLDQQRQDRLNILWPVVSRLHGEQREQGDADVVEIELSQRPLSRASDHRNLTVVDKVTSDDNTNTAAARRSRLKYYRIKNKL